MIVFVAAALSQACHGEQAGDDLRGYGPSIWKRHGSHPVVLAGPMQFPDIDNVGANEANHFYLQTSPLRQATMLQETLQVEPRASLSGPIAAGRGEGTLQRRAFQDTGIARSPLGASFVRPVGFTVDRVGGEEAGPLVTTDLGSLLRKSNNSVSTEVQARTPIINDPRVRSARVGSLAASGSYWVPARADLDTAVSKIDSRLIEDVVIIPGPYSSIYGPGFQFIDFELLRSPRYENGNELHGQTSFNHQTNGNQWFGQQSLWAGGEDWGVRGSYAHRLGTNYRAGDGTSVASDYESRTFSFAYGYDLTDARSIEFSYLRLDQTDVEFPGFVFDINVLVTDGYEVAYYADDPWIGDRSETEIWYNRTDFNGDSRNPAKAQQFPFLQAVDFAGTTDADVMSSGYRRSITWGTSLNCPRFSAGHDFRIVKQEVNEIFSSLDGPGSGNRIEGEAPLPRSFSVNPGLFAEYREPICCCYEFQSGLRLDYFKSDITEEDVLTQPVGIAQQSYINTIGTDAFQRDRLLFSSYGRLQHKFNDKMSGTVSLGYAMRPPTLTEMYATDQFLLFIQNGVNTLTGDPGLKTEKLFQLDLGWNFTGKNLRAGVRGFGSWILDYITFENTRVIPFNGEVVQTGLRYVNTDLATLAGFESFAEWRHQSPLSFFSTMRFVDGRDRTRNGDFATRSANTFFPSRQFAGLPRGAFSGVAGSDSEPLPGISPFESRVGARLRDRVADTRWTIEFAARIVDNQDRIASSLLEFETPGFTTYDVRAIWQPDRLEGLTFVTGIENLTDKTYREHLDFRSRLGTNVFQPGFNYYFGADLVY